MIYLLCVVLFVIGLLGVLTQKNLIKVIISLTVAEGAVNMFLICVGYRAGGRTPINTAAHESGMRKLSEIFAMQSVDPFPQAMVLISIIAGVSVLALATVIAIRIYHKYGTYDLSEIRKLRG